jgi:voltage-gated potassium channel Kch
MAGLDPATHAVAMDQTTPTGLLGCDRSTTRGTRGVDQRHPRWPAVAPSHRLGHPAVMDNENGVTSQPPHPLTRLNRLRDRWRDHSLTLLLVVQLGTVFGLVPATASGLPIPPGLSALLLLIVMSLIIVMARGRWTLAAGLGALLLTAATAIYQRHTHTIPADIAADLVALATFAVLSAVVGKAIFGPGRFSGHRIQGAIVLYLNLGLMFAFLHRMLATLDPASYAHLPDPHFEAAFRAAMDYFSFVTLTSIGYGDIVPVTPFARSLSTLEATVGQLFPTVLIGRVVVLAMRERD